MASVDLQDNDIALAANVAATRIVIPHLTAKTPSFSAASALIHFDGFADPFEYRGEAMTETIAYECKFTPRQHTSLVAFLALWRRSRTEADGTFQIRTRIGAVPGLNPVEFVAIPALSSPFEAAGFVAVSFAATRVHRDVAV